MLGTKRRLHDASSILLVAFILESPLMYVLDGPKALTDA